MSSVRSCDDLSARYYVCIKLLNGDNSRVIKRFAAQQPQTIYLCTITELELFYGAYRSAKTERNLLKLDRFFSQFTVLPFDSAAAQVAGEVRANLNSKGTPIGGYALQIAATALAYQPTLVTHNTREFERVEELLYEDWEV